MEICEIKNKAFLIISLFVILIQQSANSMANSRENEITYELAQPRTNLINSKEDNWILIEDRKEMFSALLPVSPEIKEKEIKSEFGFIKGKGYFVKALQNDLNLFYGVIVATYNGVSKFF